MDNIFKELVFIHFDHIVFVHVEHHVYFQFIVVNSIEFIFLGVFSFKIIFILIFSDQNSVSNWNALFSFFDLKYFIEIDRL